MTSLQKAVNTWCLFISGEEDLMEHSWKYNDGGGFDLSSVHPYQRLKLLGLS